MNNANKLSSVVWHTLLVIEERVSLWHIVEISPCLQTSPVLAHYIFVYFIYIWLLLCLLGNDKWSWFISTNVIKINVCNHIKCTICLCDCCCRLCNEYSEVFVVGVLCVLLPERYYNNTDCTASIASCWINLIASIWWALQLHSCFASHKLVVRSHITPID